MIDTDLDVLNYTAWRTANCFMC